MSHVRQAHAVGRKDAGEGVHQQPLDSQTPSQGASVLSASSAEHDQRVVAGVVAARDGDVPDRLRHVRVGDLKEALGDLVQ